MISVLLCAACATGVALVLVADRSDRRALEWVGKPLASVAFVLAALHWGALDTAYGRWVLLGLVLGAAGDVLLIPRERPRLFLAGMNAFLLGHVAYVVAFAALPLHGVAALIAAPIVVMALLVSGRWLLPQAPEDFRLPLLVYLCVIGAMVVAAISAVVAGTHWLIAAGAIGFALSDLSVARDQFVRPALINRVWGLPLYFASQMMIAASVALVAR
ncbi:lysoplasmalogenase [Algiphilus aromaticivorans]|uniref:lysoplasmalogenase n=1 Tax=Algiphilus aromaticivorans TaxID=382454 RepID=UPI0005C226DC|nr:lysoplasmalogenase [Algiphilus aromaticivorans]